LDWRFWTDFGSWLAVGAAFLAVYALATALGALDKHRRKP
jgi:hypothetical protein